MRKNVLYGIGIAVIALGIGFYSGIAYAGGHGPARGGMAPGNFAGGMRGGFAGRSGLVSGTVLSKDAGSITIRMMNGSTRIVLTSASTTVAKSAPGSLADVAAGENVSVSGTANSDGSLTADSLELRPVLQSGR
ncbi:MAG: DUF5666 domain-containing protein [bacterium]